MIQSSSDTAHQTREATIAAMKAVFGTDVRRIEHAMKVLGFAEDIMAEEPGRPEVVVAAAILHDIGILEAERKHGSTVGHFQEIEGPPIARGIMQKLGFEEDVIEHVCCIIANHHTARNIDTPEFRIVWDADWLANIPDDFSRASQHQLDRLIGRVFRTAAGKGLGQSLYGSPQSLSGSR
ncbi:MAG: HD domain-containing protein [Thermoguttaceae bacterium]|jgi:HD superfamily phosphodiesterase|nr:HD domain-containing protein [Thermoguttaceae bacterium]